MSGCVRLFRITMTESHYPCQRFTSDAGYPSVNAFERRAAESRTPGSLPAASRDGTREPHPLAIVQPSRAGRSRALAATPTVRVCSWLRDEKVNASRAGVGWRESD
jgi:hypothetical protein